jgi:CO dehydrogenase nickel-insertion accessory protein CooC1
MKNQLVLTMGGKGGVGKTLALVAITDYLYSKTANWRSLIAIPKTRNSRLASITGWAVKPLRSTFAIHWTATGCYRILPGLMPNLF